jgi:hypothetical protein
MLCSIKNKYHSSNGPQFGNLSNCYAELIKQLLNQTADKDATELLRTNKSAFLFPKLTASYPSLELEA